MQRSAAVAVLQRWQKPRHPVQILDIGRYVVKAFSAQKIAVLGVGATHHAQALMQLGMRVVGRKLEIARAALGIKAAGNRHSLKQGGFSRTGLAREEYGLSVIRNPKSKGKSYIEHTAAKQGKSWKAQLKNTIDVLIPLSKDFDEFLLLMEQ